MNVTSVIIVNYNTKALTANCVRSVIQHFPAAGYEIIVVDNASTDGSVDYLNENFPGIIVIANNTNAGFGTANNIGVRRAKGRFILLLNSDTIVTGDILSLFINFYVKNSHLKIGALASLLVSPEGEIIHSFGNFSQILARSIGIQTAKDVKLTKEEIRKEYFSPVDIVVGADMFMEKSVFDLVGGFDEKIFLYEEELELQLRLRKAGFISMIINEKNIVHLEGQSSESYFKRKCSFQSLCYIHKKHLSYPLYLYWRFTRVIMAVIFFKNTRTSFDEKINYLKLSVFKK